MPDQKKYKIDYKFHKILQREDDLGLVIRVHISIEQQLNEFLSLFCCDFNALEGQEKLSYFQKVCLAEALGVVPEYSRLLKVLGKLRNNFAHKPNVELTVSNVSGLYEAFSSDGKKILQGVYDVLRKKAKSEVPKSFKKLPPKDKFILLAVTIQSRLRVAIGQKKDSLGSGELTYRCECGKNNLVELPSNYNKESPEAIAWSCLQCEKEYQFEFSFTKI